MQNIKLEIQYVSIDEIQPYEHNAKLHPKKQIDQICRSIEQFGFNDPIAIDENGTIIEGHGRHMAAKKLGINTIPIIRLSHMSESQKKAYILAHNKLTMNTDFDLDVLNAELASLSDIDMSDFGFDVDADDRPEAEDDNYDGAVPAEPKSKLGDMYRLGNHILLVGDSTSPEDVARLMGGNLADMVVTDPPYDVDYSGSRTMPRDRINNDNLALKDFITFLDAAIANLRDNLKPGGAFYIWCASYFLHIVLKSVIDSGLLCKQSLIWVKNHFSLGRQDYDWNHEPCIYGWKYGATHYFNPAKHAVTTFDNPPDFDKMKKDDAITLLKELFKYTDTLREPIVQCCDLHPTMKPITLFGRLIDNSSKPGDIVLDLFGGSGTTVIACEQLGRSARVMELDPAYADVIVDRWEKYTGKTAEKLN